MSNLFESKKYHSSVIQGKVDTTFDKNYQNLANILTPKSNGYIDVIKQYPWTLTPSSSVALEQTPYIELTEFYLLDSAINQLFKTYGILINNRVRLANTLTSTFGIPNASNNVLYEGLYDHNNPSGFTYKFPYFSNIRNSIRNTWSEKNMYQEILNKQIYFAGLEGKGGGAALSKIAKGAVPGIGNFLKLASEVETRTRAQLEQFSIGVNSPVARTPGEDPALDVPKVWSSTASQTFNISFPLFNILATSDILANWELCYLLSYQNLYNKRNLFTGVPPVFYQIKIPGVYFSKAGYVSKLSIKNIGNIHNIPLTIDGELTNINIPDVYHIDMTITDFFIPSKNFLDAVNSTNKVTTLNKSIESNQLQTPTDAQNYEDNKVEAYNRYYDNLKPGIHPFTPYGLIIKY